MSRLHHLLSDVFAGRVSEQPCAHKSYDVLRDFGDLQVNAVEEMDARCRECGQLVNVQIWHYRTTKSVEVWPMTPQQIARKGYAVEVMK